MVANDMDSVRAHADQAREFLGRALEYFASGDLHQASEKGWGAAAHMAKAVALTQGWQYDRHSDFHQIINQARRQTGNDQLRLLSGRANDLHANFYDLRSGLDDDVIREDLGGMTQLLDILEPLTEQG